MGEIIKWIVVIAIRVGFWASVIFTFIPLLTLIVSGILVALNGTVVMDLFYLVQLWLPFNLNVVMLWCLTLVTAFAVWWLAQKVYYLLNTLVKV